MALRLAWLPSRSCRSLTASCSSALCLRLGPAPGQLLVRSASGRPGASAVLGQLRGDYEGADATSPSQTQALERKGRTQVLGVDRDILAGGGGQVLLHDYRELKFLKQITAAGIAGALFSSSGLAYAVSFNLGVTFCSFCALQTAGASILLAAYLRSYVARAALDPRRARLVITGCSLFGEPLATEQQLPLAMIQPGADVGDHYIKFRIKGSMWNPACWIYYRMPRAKEDGALRKPGAMVGHRASVAARSQRPASTAVGPTAAATSQHSFRGAGLGAGDSEVDANSGLPRGFAAPKRIRPVVEEAGRGRSDEEAEAIVPSKSLAGLRLHHGLPAAHSEEQKILDFFEDPMSYAARGLRLV